MEFIRFDTASNDAALVGNKAAKLGELQEAGYKVPAFFVTGGHASHQLCRTALHTEIVMAAKQLCRDGRNVAVRSSSVEEDGSKTHSPGSSTASCMLRHATLRIMPIRYGIPLFRIASRLIANRKAVPVMFRRRRSAGQR